jgi:riboflavin kinase/FMN adenylyltransferase
MQILTVNDTLKPDECTVLTVGNFDGVHRGHRKLLMEIVRRAAEKKVKSAAVTFDPPTRIVTRHGKGYNYSLLTTFEEKAQLIGLAGVDYLMRITFDDAMRKKEPEAFIEEFLVRKLHMTEWVLGHGHAMGRNRAGNEKFLHTMESKYHFTTLIIDLLAQGRDTISSTQIREFITHGRIAEAVRRLGHPYLISVERIQGKKLGTKLGYPTFNFKSPPSRKVIPSPGVYAAELEYRGRSEEGALYFGECPTLHEHREVHFEFHSFNRGKEEIAVGEQAHLWLYSFVRPDRIFSGTGDLVKQIAHDVEKTKNFFMKEKVQWR